MSEEPQDDGPDPNVYRHGRQRNIPSQSQAEPVGTGYTTPLDQATLRKGEAQWLLKTLFKGKQPEALALCIDHPESAFIKYDLGVHAWTDMYGDNHSMHKRIPIDPEDALKKIDNPAVAEMISKVAHAIQAIQQEPELAAKIREGYRGELATATENNEASPKPIREAREPERWTGEHFTGWPSNKRSKGQPIRECDQP